MKVLSVVGARPNFMKMAPFIENLKQLNIKAPLLHTGQHYDEKMSDIFFKELNMPEPNYYLGIGGGTHANQTGRMIIELERVFIEEKPDVVAVAGDVNSTLAASLVASKLHIETVHIEAGLRSFDRRMPEEINRIVTDRLSSLLLPPSEDGVEHLLKEGIDNDKIFNVGNLMIDTLNKFLDIADNYTLPIEIPDKYALITLHRPSNVDKKDDLKEVIDILSEISTQIPMIFPIHPRTKNRLKEYNIFLPKNIIFIDPVGYLEFLNLMKHSTFVITDSGGIQEETTVLKKPCLTMRENTERPITVTMGTNEIVGRNKELILKYTNKILNGTWKQGQIPPLWDGNAGKRAAEKVIEFFNV